MKRHEPPPLLETLPELCTVEEAAAFLRVGKTMAYELAAKDLHAIRVGRLLRIPRCELERFARGEGS